ncbi:MAG: S8 family serine peptidase [Bacillota bacterium]
MKTLTRITIMLLLMAFITATVASASDVSQSQAEEKVTVLVGFKGSPDASLIRRFGGEVRREFALVPVISARMNPKAAEALAKNPHVRYVELDTPVYALQEVPWGVDRVFGAEDYYFPTWNDSQGAGVKVAVLDTGVADHPDLPVVSGGYNALDGTNRYADGNGHGTHVAGTIAAVDNSFGVVGVAPGVRLYAVKVLDDSGKGSVESVVAGIEWAVNNGMQVINMSLGASSDSQTLKDACDSAYAAGLLLVAAAGNNGNPPGKGDNVNYPAKYASVIAVAASDEADKRATFSSTGPDVELIAPGVRVKSTVPGGTYATYSGTSMASPHAAGVAALVWAANPALGNLQVREILRGTAQDLGLRTEHQGYGLVRADLAVAAALAHEPQPEPGFGAIQGIVTDGVYPLAGASVVVKGTSLGAVTDDSGHYFIAHVPTGSHEVVASHPDCVPATKQVSVARDTTTTLDFALTRKPLMQVGSIKFSVTKRYGSFVDIAITVTVVDSGNGAAVPGAKVSMSLVHESGSWEFSGSTKSAGTVTFTLKKAPLGTFTATVVDASHETYVWDGILKSEQFTVN